VKEWKGMGNTKKKGKALDDSGREGVISPLFDRECVYETMKGEKGEDSFDNGQIL